MTPERTAWNGVAFGLALASFAAYQFFKIPPVLPALIERYGYDRTLAAGFMSIYALFGLALSLPLGRRIARKGLKTMILFALGMMAGGNLLALALPASSVAFLTARGMEGIGFAILAIAGPVLANANANPRHLGLVIGLTAAWIPLGQIAAGLIAPLAFATIGWQLLWLVALAGSALLAYWTLRLGDSGLLAPGPPLGASVQPEQFLTNYQRVTLLLTAVIFMLWSGQYFAAMTWLPLYLVEVYGLNLNISVLGYLLPVVVLLAFNLLTGALLGLGLSLRWLLVAALILQGAVWWLIPAVNQDLSPAWSGLALLVAYGVAAGITPTCLFALPSRILGPGRSTAAAFGVVMTGRNIGVLVGPLLIAQISAILGSWDATTPIFGMLMGVAVGVAGLLAVRIAPPQGTKR